MQIEQAIFTSAQTARAQGYHLVARSPGIDDRLAQQLAIWSPSQNSLVDKSLDAESVNVYSVDDQWIVISRTVSAGAEYSDRGEFRLETNMLVVHRPSLAEYENHPLALFRVAFACGHLRLRSRLPAALPTLRFPSSMGKSPVVSGNPDTETLIESVVSKFGNQRLVIVGSTAPMSLLRGVYCRLPARRRLELSFSTGLKPSIHRPFHVQFLPAVNEELTRELDSRGMICLLA